MSGAAESRQLALKKGVSRLSTEGSMLVRRLVLVLSTVVVTSLGFVVGVVAAGGGLAPGSYTFTNFGASATFGGGKGIPTPQPTFFLSVNRGLNAFQGEDSQGSGSVSNSTMVLLTMIDTTGNSTSGCFQVASTDFKVGRNLQSASLHTTLSNINQCGGKGQPIGPLRPTGVLPAAGSLGGAGLPLPISLDVTWTGVNVVSTLQDQFSFACLGRQEQGSNTFRDSLGGSASGSISWVIGSQINSVTGSTPVADLTSQDGHLEIEGNNSPPCPG